MEDIEDRLDSPDADNWYPEVGDKIIGTVVEILERDSKYGPYPVVVLELDNGELWAVHAGHVVLRSELARQHLTEGDRLGVKYLGFPPEKDYACYRVAVEHTNGSKAWDGFDEDEEPLRRTNDKQFHKSRRRSGTTTETSNPT